MICITPKGFHHLFDLVVLERLNQIVPDLEMDIREVRSMAVSNPALWCRLYFGYFRDQM
jgi:hypothetical protein